MQYFYESYGMNKKKTAQHFGLSPNTIDNILGNPRLQDRRRKKNVEKIANGSSTTHKASESSQVKNKQANGSKSPVANNRNTEDSAKPAESAPVNDIKTAAIAAFKRTGSFYQTATAIGHGKISDIILWVKEANLH